MLSGSGKAGRRATTSRRLRWWVLWSLPLRVVVPVVAVDTVAVVVLGYAAIVRGTQSTPMSGGWFWLSFALVTAGVVSTEASLGVERLRHRSDDSPHIDLSSVWVFAAAALLPGLLAAVVAIAIYLHIDFRVWRRSGVPPHRVVFSTATIVLAVQAASAVTALAGHGAAFRSGWGVLAVVVAMLTYALVNITLVVGMIVLSAPSRDRATLRQIVGSVDDVVLEFATLSMGALVAAAIASFGPAYVLLGLPPLIVLHRTVLVRQLEEAVSTDSKTGLLNAEAWHVQATREVLRAEQTGRSATVLVLDLDHFKRINDQHGHLVGDQVLAAVARAVRAEVRDDDIVGRFGGEEFVVLLSPIDSTPLERAGTPVHDVAGLAGRHGAEAQARLAATTVADRIRRRVAALRIAVPGSDGAALVEGLTVSIGGALRPDDGVDLPRLIEVADAAMYEAKRAGRNCVRIGYPAHEAEEVPRTG